MSNPPEDRLLKFKDVANLLAICVRGVYRLIASGDLAPPVKVMRSARIRQSDVFAYIEKLKRQRDGGR